MYDRPSRQFRTIVSVSNDRLGLKWSSRSHTVAIKDYQKILKHSKRALKDENRRLHNKLDQLSLHGTQVDQHEESPAESADDELEKETNLLKTEIMLMKKSLTEVSKLNTDLKVHTFFTKKRRQRCWWRMLKTKFVGDKFKMLVTDLRCWWPI